MQAQIGEDDVRRAVSGHLGAYVFALIVAAGFVVMMVWLLTNEWNRGGDARFNVYWLVPVQAALALFMFYILVGRLRRVRGFHTLLSTTAGHGYPIEQITGNLYDSARRGDWAVYEMWTSEDADADLFEVWSLRRLRHSPEGAQYVLNLHPEERNHGSAGLLVDPRTQRQWAVRVEGPFMPPPVD